jgi:hypothetical protein
MVGRGLFSNVYIFCFGFVRKEQQEIAKRRRV